MQNLRNIGVVAKREYLSRVKTKGFWIGTVVLPVLIAALMVLPSILLLKTKSALETVVVDQTGVLAQDLLAQFEGKESDLGSEAARVSLSAEEPTDDPLDKRAELDRRVLAGDLGAWIWLDEESLSEGTVEFHAESVSNFVTQSVLERALSRVVRSHRLEGAGYDPETISTLVRSISLSTVRVTETGGKKEEAVSGIIVAFALFFILYIVLIIYGQQVLHGVLEEKTSRIVEVIVSAVRPFELMMGKLVGICGVALTQLSIWIATMVVVTLPGVVAVMAWIPEDVSIPSLQPSLLVHFFLLFLLGFFLFASVYAAIGAAFNSVQEAQQVAGAAVILVVAPFLFMNSVLNDPDSTMAVVASLVPFLTPLLMLLRIAIKTPPMWQILLGYL
ncbi:MAG: ABC transporter permease, partial [Acidobacteriota bacterium]|nr:ABC transporter permease [Acidobacteriota bacterium]